MGGGGGGGSNRLGDTRALEEKAKRVLEGGRKNVFISFAHEDVDEVNLLRGQSKNENSDIEFNDFSVKEPYDSVRAEYIKGKLTERINQSSTTVVYLSKDTPTSQWVRWEVEKSIELGKRVIAVHAGKTAPGLPSWVGPNKIKVVPWSSLSQELSKS
ncbi:MULTISPECIES: TIR domain-containing protein [unclassified Bradyrhizobium]|uniref:TIR domain-containing protein n=1 Tax=unclassified Bradyrhizobium TaxID=2631580 RepID=UPI001FFB7CEA|nr:MULTISPECIES: TIR domain-containing protein [unclassified Bradyrhizobium]MCK1424818.1 TIR domain-containing protein [Bradyrhizobium sp. CW12]MCK1644258.1 TIR domain-containing protein [Bradyrhizobium sp. 154]